MQARVRLCSLPLFARGADDVRHSLSLARLPSTSHQVFSCWIILRDGVLYGLPWTVAMMVLGNWTAACYVFLAALRCGGSAERLMLGDRRAASAQLLA